MLHQHSTLFGIGTALVLTLPMGLMFHWSPLPMVVIGLLGVLILPRVFYGLKASRELDKAPYSAPAGTGWMNHDWDPVPTEEERLEKAIQAAKGYGPGIVGPDANALQRLAEEEAQQ